MDGTTPEQHAGEVPIRHIQHTIRQQVYTAFREAAQRPLDYGLTLDDLEAMTGARPHSISGARLTLEKCRLIVRTEHRRWNRSRTRMQYVYRMVRQ